MKTSSLWKEKDWVSVQPKTKKGLNNGPRVNGIVRRVHRKGIFVEHQPHEVHASFNHNPKSVLTRFNAEDVKTKIPFF